MSKPKRHQSNGLSPYYSRSSKQLSHKSRRRKRGEMAHRARDISHHNARRTRDFLAVALGLALERNAGSLFRL